nr:MAG TPA: DNA TRANSLOCASE FTSK [Caudoviricetes sp.]
MKKRQFYILFYLMERSLKMTTNNLYYFAPVECFAADDPCDDAEVEQLANTAVQAVAFAGLQATEAIYTTAPQLVRVHFDLDFASAYRVPSLLNRIEKSLNAYLNRNGCRCYLDNGLTVEIPRAQRQTVRMRQFLIREYQRMKLPAVLGIDSNGHQLVIELADAPHLLIAGQTGSGKSVCLNDILVSILQYEQPADVQFLLIDPKQVELSKYACIPHLAGPIATTPEEALNALHWAVDEMERRYTILRQRGAAGLDLAPGLFSRLVIAIDELADLIQASKKEVETLISRLAAKGRAAGIHLIVATQYPSAKIITGAIKANIPTRIAFKTSSNSDSRVILDMVGAEKLTGKGDGLFFAPASSVPQRFQACYLSPEEINTACHYAWLNSPQGRRGTNGEEKKHTAGAVCKKIFKKIFA